MKMHRVMVQKGLSGLDVVLQRPKLPSWAEDVWSGFIDELSLEMRNGAGLRAESIDTVAETFGWVLQEDRRVFHRLIRSMEREVRSWGSEQGGEK